jgi:Arc/MetJ family transcription regulator
MCMRTNIDVDDSALEAAQRELGTTTKKDTINAALAYVAARGARVSREINNAFDFWGADVGDPETMRQARR